MANLSTTSYAILGLLSLRSWTTYELAEQMKRALGQFWPRAESGIYTEPKKLVAAGLATSRTEHVGKRARERYEITAKGREALAAWVPSPEPVRPVIEFEDLMRVFFAERGTRADLLNTLRGIKQNNEDYAAASFGPSAEYLEGTGAYPERLPWLILVGRFFEEFTRMLDHWVTWAIDEVEQWPQDIREATPAWNILEEEARTGAEYAARVQAREEEASSTPV